MSSISSITHLYPLKILVWSMNLITLSLPSGHLGSSCCVKSLRQSVNASTSRKATTQVHQTTVHRTSGQFKIKMSSSIQIQTRFQTPKSQGVGARLHQHAIQTWTIHQLSGSHPASIVTQPVVANCNQILSYPKLEIIARPY